MSEWNYGDAYLQYPIEKGIAQFKNGSMLQTHTIFNPLPSFMLKADALFIDPPWNKGNMTSFYTKAQLPPPAFTYSDFYNRLFECIQQISPHVCYVEIGKDHLADFIIQMRRLYHSVTFYNSTYYHKSSNLCYVVRGTHQGRPPKLDGMDEEDIISWVCSHEKYSCIGDLCMGRGLVAVNAFKSAKKFVGTELNHKRLSVTLKRLAEMGAVHCVNNDF